MDNFSHPTDGGSQFLDMTKQTYPTQCQNPKDHHLSNAQCENLTT